jgi:hypothetical protein
MPDIDALLREFRADAPPPAPGAAERIVARARPPAQAPPSRSARSRRGVRISARLVAVAAGLAAAAILVVALTPDGDDPGRSSFGGLLERAEAAVTPHGRILALSFRMRITTTDPAVVPEDRVRDIRMREWVLAGDGDAVLTRTLISEGPSTSPPTDEDTTMLLDRRGRLAELRSWTPQGPQGGVLRVDTSKQRGERVTLTGLLREAYERGDLRPASRHEGGLVLLRGDFLNFPGCGHTEVLLDPQSFIPRRIEVERTEGGRIAGSGTARDCGPGAERQVWTISSQRLEASERNRRLLEIGDWPIATFELNGKRVDPDRIPPMPPLDER